MQPAAAYDQLKDVELASLAAARDVTAIRTITTRNNQRLFRTAWSVLRHHDDAEDAVQQAYLKAFGAIGTYSGAASLSTWLTRIVLNVAIDQKRQAQTRRAALEAQDVSMIEDQRALRANNQNSGISPERQLARAEVTSVLNAAIAALPEAFRLIFVLRELEDLSVRETADITDLPEATVKTRLHRARQALKQTLETEFGDLFTDTVAFAGADCVAMTSRVLAALDLNPEGEKTDD